jgi:poly(hydroxyalkanoate) depolymerase family esterase
MAIILLIAGSAGSSGATLTEVKGFGSNPGNLRMFKYIPSTVPSSPALVVALHGCQQQATSYDDETGWVKLADRFGFALLLAEQKGLVYPSYVSGSGNMLWMWDVNNVLGCFNWFEPGDTRRGGGEALSIKQMIDRMTADHNIDTSRIYITGVSAGGAMSGVMLATYPEVFAGGAIIAGIPYRCASTAWEGYQCMRSAKELTPAQWGNRVRRATNYTGPWPKVSIWQGDSDTTVNTKNAREIMEQWTNVHGIDQQPEVEEVVNGHIHKVYLDTAGKALVETYSITGMGHGVPVDPGPGDAQCGISAPFILDADICSSWEIAKFWGMDRTDVAPGSN